MKLIYKKILQGIPDVQEFLTAEELDVSSRCLAQRFPEVVTLTEIGRSREDRPLLCLKIGEGSKNALVFGLPHPNEPIGTAMLEYFTVQLAENEEFRRELDYTWYIVKAWDIDGYKLNEGWLKGPFTISNYSRRFFRPAGYKQVDWTFPIRHKKLNWTTPLPETKAMMDLIDEIKPEFIYALHNAGFGGAYWYVTEDVPKVYEELWKVPEAEDVPVSYGEPEAPFLTTYAPAIYKNMGIGADYDYYEQNGVVEPQEVLKVGTCAADYAKAKHGSFTFLAELPYFYDERIEDRSESEVSRKDAVLQNLDWNEEMNHFMKECLVEVKEKLDPENPFFLAVENFTQEIADTAYQNFVQKDPSFLRPATVAEKFDILEISRFYKLLSLGMLVRMFEWEIEHYPEKEMELAKQREKTEQVWKKLAAELEEKIHYEVIPIRKLVRIQMECGLILAEYIHSRDTDKGE